MPTLPILVPVLTTGIILVSVMDFTDVLMLIIWPILVDTDTDIGIGASLIPTMSFIQHYITLPVLYQLCLFLSLSLLLLP